MFLLPVVVVLILNVEMIMMVTLLIPFVVAAVAVVVAGPVGAVSRDNPFLYALLILDIQVAASSATIEIRLS